MILSLDIVRGDVTVQVACFLDGEPVMEFYGFAVELSDEEIAAFIRADLLDKGYALES